MIKAVFKDKSEVTLNELSDNGLSGVIDGINYNWDLHQKSENSWNVINEKGESFSIVLEKQSVESKEYVLKIDGVRVEVSAQSEFDLLLKDLGISTGGTKKLKVIKAPMPGLVLDVQVKEGDLVKEGDIIVILEAMKMENVIKATGDAEVKTIRVKNGETIDKGEVMVNFV